ncbi:hypothetical protein J7E63_23280 [Bacillus sp. ISL-75]|uniref:hypothetical protein n=1 Tax=Bacillus sp. ISL-75 TaxID=2819137 RepID=UPI001BE63595|nr:hypothetical protein [Bacillus sp. ISL-75]MBT2729789.1 hypothetical protein [Bacillus sp. ISL-75]
MKAMHGIGVKKTTFYKLEKEYERKSKNNIIYIEGTRKKVAFAQREQRLFSIGNTLSKSSVKPLALDMGI